MFDCARTMVVEPFVVVSPNIATWKILLDPFQELHVFGHHVFELAVFRTFLHHPNLPVALQNRKRAWFTDTLEDVNGVATTIRKMTAAGAAAGFVAGT
jgi:hypothetical protein